MNEDAARPAVLNGFADVERPRGSILQTIEQDAILAPWNLCSKLLHNFTVRPGLGKGAHVLEIASGVTRELWKLTLKVIGKTVDDLCAPPLAFLTSQDVASNFPIMQDKLGIGCECSLDLGCSDALLDRLDEAFIKLCSRLLHKSRGRRFPSNAHRSKSSLALRVIRV